MNFSELQSTVARRLRETLSSAVYYTKDDIKTSINEGYEELSDATEWYENNAMVNLSGKNYYNLEEVIEDGVLSLKHIWHADTSRWLTATDIRDLDERTYVYWETTTGQPQRMFLRGLFHLGLWPMSATGTVKIFFTGMPDALSADSDEPGFPQEFHQGIIEYAVYDLLCQSGETKKALSHWAMFIGVQEALRYYVNRRNSLDRIGGKRG